jgi:polysaccharide biosynthesis transport protein
MNRRLPSDLSDFGEVLRRRRWWFILTPLIVIAVALPIIFKWPKTWEADTTIQVEPQQVPSSYVASTVTTDAAARLQMITQQVLSRTHLQRVIDRYGLYRDEKGKSPEDIVELMQKDISVQTILDPQQAQHPERVNSLAFKISYQGSDRSLVTEVTQQLGNLFTEENERIRQAQAVGTTEFLDSQVEKAKVEMRAKQKLLTDFEAHHVGTLPDQQGGIFAIMGQLQGSLAANSDAIARAEDRKTYDQSLIAFLSKNTPVDAAGNPVAVPVQSLIQAQLEARKSELLEAEQKYTARHPDVVRLKEEVAALAKLAKQPSSEATGTPKGTVSPISLQTDYTANQLRSEMLQLDQEIKHRSSQQALLEGKLKNTEARLDGLPATAQVLSDLGRDYTAAEKNYEHLLEEKNASDVAAAMENGAKGETFRVLDPPTPPDEPIKPNLLLCSLMACAGGIGAGILLGLAAELRDKRINNDRDVAYYLPVPLLASLPVINRGEEKRRVLQLKGQTEVITIEPSAHSEPTGARIPGSTPARTTVDPAAPSLSLLAARSDRSQTPLPDLGAAPSKPLPEGLRDLWYRGASGDNAFAMEQLKIVRTRLRELMRVRTMRTLMVTSSVQGEGKTMVAANLAYSMSQLEGLKVLLVDADLRKASLATFLNMKPQLGLSTYLMNGKCLTDVRQQLSENLAVVPTLTLEDNAAELLNGRRMRDFLHEALRDYDLIIVDAPPVVPIADAQVLTSMVDGALLVVRAGTCPFDLACSAVELLQPKIVGVILNGVDRLPNSSYYYGYYGKAAGNLQWSKS